MKTSTVLRKAKKLIQTKGLCKGALARNKYRHEVKPSSKSAASYCAVGAIEAVIGTELTGGYQRYLNRAIRLDDEQRFWGVVAFNDRKSTTAKDVVKLFNKAIALAKADGQ